VDEDNDGRLSFHEFMLVFRKAKAGELDEDSGLGQLARLAEIDVEKVGVNGAKEFFEAKVCSFNSLFHNRNNKRELQIIELSKKSKFEEEIRQEQDERKRLEEEKAVRRQQFLEKASIFKCT